MPNPHRGSEEPGDQITDRPPDDTASDASSRDPGRSLDKQANISGGSFARSRDEESDDERNGTDAPRGRA